MLDKYTHPSIFTSPYISYDIYSLLCLLSIINEIWYNILGQGQEIVKVFVYRKKVTRLISGVNTHDSCRQIFMDYRILTVTLLYMLVYIYIYIFWLG